MSRGTAVAAAPTDAGDPHAVTAAGPGSGMRQEVSVAKEDRGFASMDREKQREIARKGGAAVSQNRQHMAEIGKKGGEASGMSRSNRANQLQNENSLP